MKNETLGIFSIKEVRCYQSSPYLRLHLAEVLGIGCVSFPGIVLRLWFCRTTVMWLPPPPPPLQRTASTCTAGRTSIIHSIYRDLVSHHTKVLACESVWMHVQGFEKQIASYLHEPVGLHNRPKIDDRLQCNDYTRRCVKYFKRCCIHVWR